MLNDFNGADRVYSLPGSSTANGALHDIGKVAASLRSSEKSTGRLPGTSTRCSAPKRKAGSMCLTQHPGSGVARFAAVSVKGRCLRTGVPSVIQMQAISQVGRAAGVLTQKYGLKDSPERSYVV